MSCDELKNFMVNIAGVGLDDGYKFGQEGEGLQRMNIACPRSILEEGLKRINAISILLLISGAIILYN
jgi:cysteine-S-conjugate beta-lyase